MIPIVRLLIFLQRWTGVYFERCSLGALGLTLQVGPHPPGRTCVSGSRVEKFTVLHTNGLHTFPLHFCSCGPAPPDRYIQLLRAGIFPATPLEPASGATFAVLRLFHKLSLQGKLTGYDFMRTLELLTDNTGLHPPPVSLCSAKHLGIFVLKLV